MSDNRKPEFIKRSHEADKDLKQDNERDSRDRSPPPKRSRDSNAPSESHIVYFSNLYHSTTWKQLKDLLAKEVGGVNTVEYLVEKNGKSKNCAVVEFESPSYAEQCVNTMNRFNFCGREMVVNLVRDPKAFFRKVTLDTGCLYEDGRIIPARLAMSKNRGVDDYGRGGSLTYSREQFDTCGIPIDVLRDLQIAGPLSKCIFACNFDYKLSCGKIYNLFARCGEITYIDLPLNEESRSKGQAVIEFKTEAEAVNAIAMLNNVEYEGRRLMVKLDSKPRGPSSKIGLPKGCHGMKPSILHLCQKETAPPQNTGSDITKLIETIFSNRTPSYGAPQQNFSSQQQDLPRQSSYGSLNSKERNLQQSYVDEGNYSALSGGYRGEFAGNGSSQRDYGNTTPRDYQSGGTLPRGNDYQNSDPRDYRSNPPSRGDYSNNGAPRGGSYSSSRRNCN
uniref:RRM domain-containing protein n=1 Tax=Parastrongyloides trichosuri TaxID=131310 RepID=A0A0N4ZKM5_PARTI